MGKILFRAKRKDNREWIEGYYCHIGHTGYEKPYIIPTYASDFYGIEIDRETLGQYTGYHAKNGTKMFVGDIIQYQKCKGIIKCNHLQIVVKWLNCPDYREDFGFWATERKIEVVGNIHEQESANEN